MIKTNTFLIRLLFFIGWMVLGISCQDRQPVPNHPDAILVEITHSAGDLMKGAENFLGLPSNLGEVIKITDVNTKCLVLGNPMKTGNKLEVLPIGLLRLSNEGNPLNIIISSPLDSTMQTITARDINEFATIHSSSKWIIEQWFINYKGFGKIKLLGWESREYVVKNLLK